MPQRPDRCVRVPTDRRARHRRTPHTRGARPGFRDDIQGMRALAVLAIMVFHAGLSPYPGGFVTLDVFFVLSGFLITHLLLREVDRTGTISLTAFYARRARRILPAATVATLGTLLATWLWLGVVEVRDTAVDAIWATLFAANVRFASQETDYFAQDQPPSPLQHYWSLAVEEQFYLVLPLLLVACVLLVRRRYGGDRLATRRTIALALAAMSTLSLFWSLHASTASPETAYFSTFTRAWEFGVGALLAMAAPRFAYALTDRARTLLGAAGLALIALACFVVTETDPYPGSLALLPVLGTGAVLVAGAEMTGRPALVQRALGCRPLRFVGDASYSLYLWHWPVLVIATQHVGRDLELAETLVAVGLSVLIALASHRLVEQPFRRPMVRLPRALALYPLSVALVLVGSTTAIRWVDQPTGTTQPAISADDLTEGPGGEPVSEEPAVALVQASVQAAEDGTPVPSGLRPGLLDLDGDRADLRGCEFYGTPFELCPRGDVDADRTIMVLGDSHGRHWLPAFEEIAERAGFATFYLVKSACNPSLVDVADRNLTGAWPECGDFADWAREQVAAVRPDLVVLSGSVPRGFVVDGEIRTDDATASELVLAGYRSMISDLAPLADDVVVLGDVPRRPTLAGTCLGARGATLADCLTSPVERNELMTDTMQEATRGTPARFVGTRDWFCAGDRCPAVVGDIVTMRDKHHMSATYAASLAEPLAERLGIEMPNR
ncbi:MAG TPA: acyltransferase family protein [Nocardioides sp.]|uniref:acyltransferase family protein n=1 Tax=Nocardioides sp. TaxID=35761 RepID=UPI002CB00C05|nr:acyltransferase family protein [Nocardioides sp.]HTW18146.1 acyltransferase family protein [Nocardioides sp.]